MIDHDGPPNSVSSGGGADAVVEVAHAVRNPVEGVARKRLRLCQSSTAIHSSVLDALEEDLCGHGASSSVIPREGRSDHSPEVFVEGSQDDLHVGRHAILAADGEDDLPVTWPASSGQVRALHEEEGRSISLVDSIRATHVDRAVTARGFTRHSST